MLLQAAANKLKAELAQFGCPPVFPVAEDDDDHDQQQAASKPDAPSAEQAVQNKCE